MFRLRFVIFVIIRLWSCVYGGFESSFWVIRAGGDREW